MTTAELETARRDVLIDVGLDFLNDGELSERARRLFETARRRYGDDILVDVKRTVEKIYRGSHVERIARLWSF